MRKQLNTKNITINIRDLSFKSEQHIIDLTRYLSEALPQIKVNREGHEIDIEAPISLSKRVVRLRIKKFLYKKGLNSNFRPISLNDIDKDGYIVKERRIVELEYY